MTYVDGSWNSVQNLFDEVSSQLENDLQEEHDIEIDPAGGKKYAPFQKFDFSWNPTEKAYLLIIKTAADNLVAEILTEPILALNALYAQARVVKKGSDGKVMKDIDGNLIWQTDQYGEFIEDWKSVSPDDIERTLIKMHEIKLDVTSRTSDLYLEAVFSRYMLKDGWNEKYSKILDGTVNEKTAAADRAVRRDKYKAFSRYWLWFKASELTKDINATVNQLQAILSGRNWRK